MDQDRLKSKWHKVRRSIVTRMMMLALVVVVVGIGLRLTILRTILNEDVVALSSSHQLAIAEYAARDINDKLKLRLEMLSGLAMMSPPDPDAPVSRMSEWLAGRRIILSFFPSGLTLYSLDGRILGASNVPAAELPPDWIAKVAQDDKAQVGKPLRLPDGTPAVVFAAPVHDTKGRATAILTGTTPIAADNFLRPVQEEAVGQSGSFLLVSPQDGLFVTAGDPRKILKPVPPPGLNPLHDRAMAGYRGTGITTNIDGVEELSAMVSIPTAGWFLVARTPTTEAMRPVQHIVKLVLFGSLLVPIVVLGALLAILFYVLRPLTQSARQLHQMANGETQIRPLPIIRDDEVGEVAKGFNFLLNVLRQQEQALLETQEKLRHMAHHDGLTGLPNRAMFEDRLDQALLRAERQDQPFALLYMDLDGFKPINDQVGHAAGDSMLRHVADRLLDSVRKSDTVARIGGDEFAVLLGEVATQDAAALVAEQCRINAGKPITLGGRDWSIGLSIGIACYPEHGKSAGELLRHADNSMYQAKQSIKAAQ
ncbi:diguanylate cyclase [Magnetospirillum sp. 64-120]|uniref:diguanylate cyclase domain-containing protein n=1 Tax=Magnetospirillum sp. 64-120 TaxID=1895778 RepID=UPI000A496476|nr:diguanylate cyclase [Magnetospirillum sp. 64-120]